MDIENDQHDVINMEIGNEQLSDDDEVNDVQRESNVVQPMLLFKLDLDNNGSDPRANVRTMIEECNLKSSNELEKYIRLECSDDFAEIYKQTKRKKRLTALYHPIAEYENETTSYITAYYTGDGNVYAQTTGHAWRIASKYGDIHFPVKIAQRLLDPRGMKDVSNIPLSGNTTFKQKRCKKPELSYENGTQNLRVRFGADLRPDASIRHPNLNCFEKSDKKIKVNVGIAFIQFNCSIKKDGMKNFINHLNRIFNEAATFTTDGRREEDTDAFKESLRRAVPQEADRLDHILKMHMRSYIIGNRNDFAEHLSGLDLCQRSISTFSYALNFIISINKKKFRFEDNNTPTLKDALDMIRQHTSTTTLRGITNGNQTMFPFDTIKIGFDQHDKNNKRHLLDLIEGTMMLNDQMFYRIDNSWYYLSEDHLRNLHIKFRGFLRGHLITDKPRILPLPWEDESIEGAYCNLYMKYSNFLVGDGCEFADVELFDLLRYDSKAQHTYLYHVKKNLSGDIRTLAFQVMTATDLLRNAWNDDALPMMRRYHASIHQKYQEMGERVPSYFTNFDNFKNLLNRPNKLTIICAVCDKIGKNPYGRKNSLQKEQDAIDYFGVNDICKAFNYLPTEDKTVVYQYFSRRCSPIELCQLIFRLLINDGFVKASNKENYGYSTSKLLLAYYNNFVVGNSQDERFSLIIWKLVQQFSSFFNSTAAKYSLMHMQTNGFEFKLCQIVRCPAYNNNNAHQNRFQPNINYNAHQSGR